MLEPYAIEDEDDYAPGVCEACREDHSMDDGPTLDRHDPISWEEEGSGRTGRVVFASESGGYWVLPDVLADHHEVEVLVRWHYLSGWTWQRTYYDDHVRGW